MTPACRLSAITALSGLSNLIVGKGFQAVFAFLLLLQVIVLLDSPRWLVAHGRNEEGARILVQLEDRDSTNHPDVVEQPKEIQVSLERESAGGKFCTLTLFGMLACG